MNRESATPRRARIAAHEPGDLNRREVVLVDVEGTRWVAADTYGERRLADLAEAYPTLDAWYAKPPEPRRGDGPQLVALNAQAGRKRLQASLVASGLWWCHRSVVGSSAADATSLPPSRPKPLEGAKATAILGRILEGVRPEDVKDGGGSFSSASGEITVEAAIARGPRAGVASRPKATGAIRRFGVEMRPLSAICVPPP